MQEAATAPLLLTSMGRSAAPLVEGGEEGAGVAVGWPACCRVMGRRGGGGESARGVEEGRRWRSRTARPPERSRRSTTTTRLAQGGRRSRRPRRPGWRGLVRAEEGHRRGRTPPVERIEEAAAAAHDEVAAAARRCGGSGTMMEEAMSSGELGGRSRGDGFIPQAKRTG